MQRGDASIRTGSAGQRRPSGATLWSVLRDRVAPVDAVLLAVVPAVLLAVYALPESTRYALAIEYTDPTLLTAYASHFVHLSTGHLLVNVVGYALVVPTAYLLSVASGRRRRFFAVFAAFLLAFPFALSGLNLAFARPAAGVGFSGILLAFVGYLALALLEFVGRQIGLPVDRVRSSWLFFLGLGLVAFMAVPGPYGMALAVAALLSGVLFLLPVVEAVDDEHLTAARGTLALAGYAELTLLGALVFVGYLVVAFPTTLATAGGITNTYSHALGFSLGYVVTYVTVLLGIDVE